MAFLATLEWDVRTTGNDANGGAFDPTAGTPGTDYSQQDSPQVIYTDLVIDGSVNTKCTSSAHPFTSAHVGNVMNVTTGTGFTVQRVQIISVTGSTATCDKSLGTLSSTGGNGKLGGAFATIGAANALAISGHTIHIKAGTYTITTAISAAVNLTLVGYGSAHNDRGTKPLITTATNSTKLISYSGSLGVRNISFSNTAGTRAVGMFCASNFVNAIIEDCLFDGVSFAVQAENSTASAGGLLMVSTEVKNCTVGGVNIWFQVEIFGCYFHNNAGSSVAKASTQNDSMAIVRSLFAANSVAIDTSNVNGELLIADCTFANNTSSALTNTSLLIAANNIFYGNTGWAAAGAPSGLFVNNAYGSNSSGNLQGAPHQIGAVTLTADPFTNAAAGDFSLNSTAGGGAACKGAGFQL